MKTKRFYSIVCLLIILLSSVSCNSSSNISFPVDFLYNGLSTDWMTTGGNRIYSRVQNPAHMIDLETDKRYDLIRDPFFEWDEQAALVTYIFSDMEYFYYLLGDYRTSYQIVRQNHDTLVEEIIYEKMFYRDQQDIVLGAIEMPRPNTDNSYYSHVPTRFAVFENTLFLFLNDVIQAIDLNTQEETAVLEESLYNGNYSYYQGKLYLVTSNYDIYIYQIRSKKLQKLSGYKAQAILVTPAGLYFSAANDEGRLHWLDFDYQSEKVYTEKAVSAMDFSGNHLYYLSEGDPSLYCMNLDGSESQKIYDLPGVFDILCLREQHKNLLLYTDTSGDFAVQEVDI